MFIPTVIDKTMGGERVSDLYSRMLEDRIIFITGEINDSLCNNVVAQLLYLESQDNKKDISLYINSPGGVAQSGLAILDTMQYISAPVSTICIGMCASASALLLAGGAAGKRFILPHSKVMIHQPSGGASGQATDVQLHAQWLLRTKNKMNALMSEMTGQPLEKIQQDVERDYFMTAEEALKYGIIDQIFEPRKK